MADRVFLSSPRSGQEVRGTIEIRGTVNIRGLRLLQVRGGRGGLGYVGDDRGWPRHGDRRLRSVSGILAALSPGDYQLRLVVSDNQGQALPACVITVRVSPQA